MSLLFETIRVQDGVLRNLEYHNLRMSASQKALYKIANPVSLNDLVEVPTEFRQGIVKCRVEYGKQIENIQFSMYKPREIRTLQLVEGNAIDYSHKYTDREQLNALLLQRNDCDEILIVKNGYITDTSFSNIIFRHGNNWVTPASPLLRGTMRACLLHERKIKEEMIRVSNLALFSGARLINAMLPFGSGHEIQVEHISLL